MRWLRLVFYLTFYCDDSGDDDDTLTTKWESVVTVVMMMTDTDNKVGKCEVVQELLNIHFVLL